MNRSRPIRLLLVLGFIVLAASSWLPSLHDHDHAVTSDCGVCHPQSHAPALLTAAGVVDPTPTTSSIDAPGCHLVINARSLETAGERAPPTIS